MTDSTQFHSGIQISPASQERLEHVIAELKLARLRGLNPGTSAQAEEALRSAIPECHPSASLSLLALQLTGEQLPPETRQTTYPNSLQLALMLSALLRGDAGWLNPFTHVSASKGHTNAFHALPHLSRLHTLLTVSLHEQKEGHEAGQSPAGEMLRSQLEKDSPLKPDNLSNISPHLKDFSVQVLNHMTDLLWAIHPQVVPNMQWREALWKAIRARHSDRALLEMRPPRTRHLDFSAQPAGITRTLTRIQHPAMSSPPEWELPKLNITRCMLGEWPAYPLDETAKALANLAHLLNSLQEALNRWPTLMQSNGKNPDILHQHTLKDEHTALVVRLATAPAHGNGGLGIVPEHLIAGLTMILTQLTSLAQSPEEDDLALTAQSRITAATWSRRLQKPPSTWSLAAGLSVTISQARNFNTPARLHLYITALQAAERLTSHLPSSQREVRALGGNNPEPAVKNLIRGLMDTRV